MRGGWFGILLLITGVLNVLSPIWSPVASSWLFDTEQSTAVLQICGGLACLLLWVIVAVPLVNDKVLGWLEVVYNKTAPPHRKKKTGP
jgi:hypothetical protein